MGRCAVVVTDQQLFPPWGGNRVRILGLLSALRALGWRVVVVTLRSNVTPEFGGVVDRVYCVRGRGFSGGDISGFDVRPFREVAAEVTRTERASVVIAEYAWLAPVFLAIPRAVLRCVDCHDVLSERTTRFQAVGRDPWVICTRDQERALLSCADLLIAIQQREAATLEALVPGKRVECLLPFIALPGDFQRTSPDRLTVLSLGANHTGNDGIRRFVTDHWPAVLERHPEARLHIVGRIGAGLGPLPGTRVFGAVEDLYDHYKSAAVVLCPIEVGTGAKIKMLEALRMGKAVVATPAAAEGLPAAGDPAWLVRETGAACADAVSALLADRTQRIGLEDAAFAYGMQYLSRDCFVAKLRPLLPSRLARVRAAFRG